MSEIYTPQMLADRCVDCGSFPFGFSGLKAGWFCPKSQKTIKWDTPACKNASVTPEYKTRKIEAFSEEQEVRRLRFEENERQRIAALKTVYFINCKQFTKIGFTAQTAEKRFRDLEGANPFPLVLWATIPGMMSLERRLHKKFARWRHRGEWFKLDNEAWKLAREEVSLGKGIIYE